MRFGLIVKELLNKNNQVWIPQFGMLRYEEGGSKLIFDQTTSGSIEPLISALVQKNGNSPTEAKTILTNQVSVMRQDLASGKKCNIEGIGEIVEFNNSFQIIEAKKNLFPNDFFGLSNFDFKENKVSADFYSEVENDKTLEVNTSLLNDNKETLEPVRSELDSLWEEKIEEVPEPIIEEPTKEIKVIESTFHEEKIEKRDLFAELMSEISDKDEVDEIDDEDDDMSDDDMSDDEIEIVEEEPQIEAIKFNEDSISEESIIEQKFEEPETKIILEPEPLIIPEPEMFSEPEIIPEPEPEINIADLGRRNIGRAEYDAGYYDHLVVKSTNNMTNLRWKKVVPIAAILLGCAFFIPWLIASYQGKSYLGMNPLWVSKKVEKKNIKPLATKSIPVLKADTFAKEKVDSLNKVTKISTNTASPAIPINPSAKSVAGTLPNKTAPNQSNTKNTLENTPPKTTASNSKKHSKTTLVANTIKVKDTSTKATDKAMTKTSKKVDNSGKYTTASYTKGNQYVSFGKFTKPNNANFLKRELQAKAGVETDVIMVDGTYRVVIPYTDKEKAKAAAKEYPNTTIFE